MTQCIVHNSDMPIGISGNIDFRVNLIALIGDIRKAYLQMQLNSEERDGTRFLWVKDVNEELTTVCHY